MEFDTVTASDLGVFGSPDGTGGVFHLVDHTRVSKGFVEGNLARGSSCGPRSLPGADGGLPFLAPSPMECNQAFAPMFNLAAT